ncbi:zinc finger BED domain-containing protein RICESLEEPER 2-like [Juglans regia]|uniref:Zinc finger BED domain-containing protein RICESLEEPER 2-like n=1 Tax=Juglans regia TaxID=51240 RepID=A0A6P9F1D4_JUGRE|nr:zinc finger BED domain-containing protein RICESLEEPER 2-like [Juglans regia]
MCVTAHFIDGDWKLQKRIISFVRISDHKGATIGRELEECMLDWGIDKILTITVDNATSNDSAIDWLRTREIGSEDCVAAHEFIHMRCTAHILNLVVSEGLKDVDDSIIRVRNLIKYVKSSPQRLATFKSCVDRSKVPCSSFLCLDVPTRWNSTFLMLDVAEKYQKAFQLLLDEDPYSRVYLSEDGHGKKGLGAPEADDWETIRNFSKMIGMTIMSLFEVSSWFCGGSVTGSKSNWSRSGEASASMGSNSGTGNDDDPMDFLFEFHKDKKSASLMDCKSELERYLLEDVEIPTGNFEILVWWKVNSSKYLVLALMARDILAIPITTVASESAFSTGSRVLDPFKSSLAPRTVEALVCTQNWLKSTPICLSQNYTDAIDDAESYKLDSELITGMANLLREDD